MKFKTLSVVKPSGSRIANKEKIIEVRHWKPDVLPLLDLLIVENEEKLSSDKKPIDQNGKPVAIVDIFEVKEWDRDEVDFACASYWEDGWLSWKLENVRKIKSDCIVPAKLKIYNIELEDFEIE